VIKAVPERFVWHYKFMPIQIKEKILVIAVSDPLAVWPMEDLKLHLDYDVEAVLATEAEIVASIQRYYGSDVNKVQRALAEESESSYFSPSGFPLAPPRGKAGDRSAGAAAFERMLLESVTVGATDIHIEVFHKEARLRHRIDGILYDMRLPEKIRFSSDVLVAHARMIANLSSADRSFAQEGRAVVWINDRPIDLRISIIPALHGENMVVKVLPAYLVLRLNELGYSPQDLRRIEDILDQRRGIVFLAGPTGSGKTTMLYACLNRLNKDVLKIVTVEDRVECELGGIMQIPVKPQIGFMPSHALRNVLNHDPDVIMIDEAQDAETIQMAMHAARDGYQIFSTIPGKDALDSLEGLLRMESELHEVAASVSILLSQRLVRVICQVCREKLEAAGTLAEYLQGVPVYHGRGCEHCHFIGFKGRTAIYEFLIIDDELRQLILAKASIQEIRDKVKKAGFKTLLEMGIDRVRAGITTPEELARVLEIR
jgi:type II secretory ATPase GspE/PulE/Tfp pilus assembly ATPase PilB-like protein